MDKRTMKRLFMNAVAEHPELFPYCSDIDDEQVQVYYIDENPYRQITVNVVFIETDDLLLVHLSSLDLPNFSENRVIGLVACNRANQEEAVKFMINDSGEAMAQMNLCFHAFDLPTQYDPLQVLSTAALIAGAVDSFAQQYM